MVQSLSNLVAMKLDEENYLPCKQQAKATIEGHDLLNHITRRGIPKKFAIAEDQENEVISAEYQQWKKQDALKSWLLSLMSKPFTTRMVGCDFSHQIWARLKNFFSSQIKAKVRQLKNNLGNTKKNGSVSEYLLEIKSTIDALIFADHVEAILNGLPNECGPVHSLQL